MAKCPICDVALTEAEWKAGTCPTCASGIVEPPVPAGPSISLQDRLAWGTVRTGLGLFVFGLAQLFVSLIAEGASEQTDPALATADWIAVSAIARLGKELAIAMAVIGTILCTVVPGKTGCRVWIWSGIATLVVTVAMIVTTTYMKGHNQMLAARWQQELEFGGIEIPEEEIDSRRRELRQTNLERSGNQTISESRHVVFTWRGVLFCMFLFALARFQRRKRLMRFIALYLILSVVANGWTAMTLFDISGVPSITPSRSRPSSGSTGIGNLFSSNSDDAEIKYHEDAPR